MREDLFKSDDIWTTFAQIESALNAFSEAAKANPDYSDLQKKFDYLRWVIEKSDPSLISQNELNQTRSELNQVLAHMQSDAANWQYLPTIHNFLSQSFSRFSQVRQKRLPRSESSNLINELKSSINSLEARIQSASDDITEKASQVSVEVEDQQRRLASLKDELTKLDALAATKFDSWEAIIQADYQSKLAAWTQEMSGLQTRQNEQMSSAIKAFSEEGERVRAAIDVLLVGLKKDREGVEASFRSLYGKMQTEGQGTLKNLVEIYEQAGQVALSGGFVEASSKEDESYKNYAKLASGFFVVSAVMLGLIWYDSVENKLNGLSDVILRIPISVVFLIPAFYFASLASKHRRTAVSLRSLGLRIKAFDAYTIKASEKDKQKLREELAPVFFDEEHRRPVSSPNDEAVITKVVDRIGSAVEKAMDKLPGAKG